jgi:hypothetical protein
MSQRDHHGHHHGEQHSNPGAGVWHKDWRTWVVVGLMLAAMAAYVLSMDEEIVPGEPLQEQVPAAVE